MTGEVRTGGNSYTQYFYYDASGNRTKKTLGGTDTVYVYNTSDQLTSETTGGTTTTYEYDANGALTKTDDGTDVTAYGYNYEGGLVTYDKGDTDAAYAYDADGRRIAKTVDAATTKFFYDGSDAIADYDSDDVLIATYLTPSLDRNVSTTRSGSTYYYMADGLGSIRNLVDSNETTQNTYDYYAFGKELGSWTESVANRYTYTAREWDEESSQYYYRARYYDGGGRFNRRDPARAEANPYAYARARPVTLTDPLGLMGTGRNRVMDCCIGKWLLLPTHVVLVQGMLFTAGRVPTSDYAKANNIWSQCCIKVEQTSVRSARGWASGAGPLGVDDLLATGPLRTTEWNALLALPEAVTAVPGRVQVFYIPGFVGGAIAGETYESATPRAVALANRREPDTFAHEVGHVLHLHDQLDARADRNNLMTRKSDGRNGTDLLNRAQCDIARANVPPLVGGGT